jgi:putative PIN family toxin of toxin-antitoxin system
LIKIILDTNVLLAALLSQGGPPAQLLEAWERKKFIVVASEALIAELRGVTSRPFFHARLRVSTIELLAAGLRDLSEFYADPPQEVLLQTPKTAFCWHWQKQAMRIFWSPATKNSWLSNITEPRESSLPQR